MQRERDNTMQIEEGKIFEGTVKNIAKYGAFVDVVTESGEKFSGMVHISEVSHTYVNDITEFLKEGQTVKVKVIGTNPQGKISLSMKQCEEKPQTPNRGKREFKKDHNSNGSGERRSDRPEGSRPNREPKPIIWEPKKKPQPSEMTFEDMLAQFKQNSEDRMVDIKRGTERKNHSRRK